MPGPVPNRTRAEQHRTTPSTTTIFFIYLIANFLQASDLMLKKCPIHTSVSRGMVPHAQLSQCDQKYNLHPPVFHQLR